MSTPTATVPVARNTPKKLAFTCLTQGSVLSAVRSLRASAGGLTLLPTSTGEMIGGQLLNELSRPHSWRTRYRVRQPGTGLAEETTAVGFATTPPPERLSATDHLDTIPTADHHVRALIGAASSGPVLQALSGMYGDPLVCLSTDVIRLKSGQYRRRESEAGDLRSLALVFYVSRGWRPGFGGELLVEGPGGEVCVAAPRHGCMSVLRFDDGYHYGLAAVSSKSWVRYAIALYYGVAR